MLELELSKHFTDLDDRFDARLSAVLAVRRTEVSAETTGFSAKYECRVKTQYQKDLMGLLEEGMLIAVRNFKAKKHDNKRFTLLEISRIGPEHFGLRGLSDTSYYPYQFEIIEQSMADWDTDDRATMMIQISAIPLNYDLIITGSEHQYVKGFTYPIVGERVYILSKNTIHKMYNRQLLQELGLPWDDSKIVTNSDARKDPRIGVIKMFQEEKEPIPIYVSYERLARYHFGIFSFTGGGKSNLVSNILRRILYHTKNTKVVIFDISMEYPFLLQDVFADKSINSKIITEIPVTDADHFRKIIVTPRKFEKADITPTLQTIWKLGRLGHYVEGSEHPPTYEDMLEDIKSLAEDEGKKAVNLNAITQVKIKILQWVKEHKLERSQTVTKEFLDYLQAEAIGACDKFKVWKSGGLYAWASTRSELAAFLQPAEEEDDNSYGAEKLVQLLEGDVRLLCLSIVEPSVVKQLAITLTSDMLRHRKREFQVDPQILFVFDEAQEFIPAYEKARGIDSTCTQRIETLLRQGRKYGLGGCVATQRIAYLNTNALQQLHTYFVGPLPRPYDRSLVSSTFTIDQGILEKTLEFAPGQWLLSSYIATGMENVPIFITADNSEVELERVTSSSKSATHSSK